MRRHVVDGRQVAAVKQVAIESVENEVDRLVWEVERFFEPIVEVGDHAFECDKLPEREGAKVVVVHCGIAPPAWEPHPRLLQKGEVRARYLNLVTVQ